MTQASAPFKVFAASAGSGKTHNLVLEYLERCLSSKDPQAFAHILATTFTVKASQEMKSRILDTLAYMAGVGTADRKALRDQLLERLGCTPEDLQRRSRVALGAILHQYTGFAVGTIDNFTTKLIRTFAPELGLHPGFDLELDTRSLLREAVDLTLQKVGTQPNLTEILQNYQDFLVEDDRNWDFRASLLDTSNLLFDENHRQKLRVWLETAGTAWKGVYNSLSTQRKALEAHMKERVRQGEKDLERVLNGQELTAHAKPYTVFERAKQSKWAELMKEPQEGYPTGKVLAKALVSGEGYLKKADQKAHPHLEGEIHRVLRPLFDDLAEKLQSFAWIDLVVNSFMSMVALAEIERSLEEIKEERQIRLLAEFNQLISDHLKDEPASFLYERMGERFEHFFVDEFQDTSELQWRNMIPLMENAIAQGGSAMIVGDGKQAIYRWRNGHVEQFLDLITKARNPGPNLPMWQQGAALHALLESRRSAVEIVAFVNRFLTSQASVFEDPQYGLLMAEGLQKAHKTNEGLVELHFLDKEDASHPEMVAAKCLECKSDGYAYGQMAVLVRTNDQVKAIADELRKNGIEVVSPESLLLKEQEVVQFLTSALGALAGRKRPEDRFYILQALTKAGKLNPLPVRETKQRINKDSSLAFLDFLDRHARGWNTRALRTMGLFEAARTLAVEVGYRPEDPIAMAFLTEVLTFGDTRQGSIRGFLQWWETRDPRVELPDAPHAVRVMTIHKSKGLEFPVVIYPFATQSFAPTSGKYDVNWATFGPVEGMDEFLVPLKPSYAEWIGGAYAEAVRHNQDQRKLDTLNIAYVAMTRAEERLILFTTYTKDFAEVKSLSSAFTKMAVEAGKSPEKGAVFVWGQQRHPAKETQESDKEPVPPALAWGRKPAEGLRVAATYPVDWASGSKAIAAGETLHALMALWARERNVDRVVKMCIQQGLLAPDQRESMQAALKRVVANPQFAAWVQDALHVYAERPLIQGGQTLRPDLLVEWATGWGVIDYKTGEADEKHKRQVDAYARILAESGKQVTCRALVYLSATDVSIIQNW